MVGSDVNSSIVNVPLEQEKSQGEEHEHFPQLERMAALLAGHDPICTNLHGRARLDITLVRIEQIDRKAPLPAPVPAYLVHAQAMGIAKGEIGACAAVECLRPAVRIGDVQLTHRHI